jgi:hypothetical protein
MGSTVDAAAERRITRFLAGNGLIPDRDRFEFDDKYV